jgi:hypothetical protein
MVCMHAAVALKSVQHVQAGASAVGMPFLGQKMRPSVQTFRCRRLRAICLWQAQCGRNLLSNRMWLAVGCMPCSASWRHIKTCWKIHDLPRLQRKHTACACSRDGKCSVDRSSGLSTLHACCGELTFAAGHRLLLASLEAADARPGGSWGCAARRRGSRSTAPRTWWTSCCTAASATSSRRALTLAQSDSGTHPLLRMS